MNRLLLVILSLLMSVPAYAKEPIRVFDCMVDRVLDGDTVSCAVKASGGTFVKVRLYGIDAPEGDRRHYKSGKLMKPGQTYGNEATEALRAKVYQSVITVTVTDIDKYKRMVGLVNIGNRNINKEMIEGGHAWAYKQYLDTPYRSEFIQLEEQARLKGLGLWKEANPEPPWEFRHKKKISGE